MKENKFCKKAFVIATVILFLGVSFTSVLGTNISPEIKIDSSVKITNDLKSDFIEIILPPPKKIDMVLEESIFRRKSVRNFTSEPVTDEDLSTILWAAYGLREDMSRTVPSLDGMNGAIIYVLLEDAAYTYYPENHSLVFYKDGDWRDIIGYQYLAPVQLGMCYDKNKITKNLAGAEIGMIDQNIQFVANALGLGTVVTAQIPPAIDPLGIPSNQLGFTVMPIGHPDYDSYNFKRRPMWISFLPRIKGSDMSLSDAIEQRKESDSFGGELSRKELSQITWATCGFSPYIDKGDEIYHKGRHRTIPSGKGYYPIDIYVVKNNAIFKYQPNLLAKINAVPVDFLGLPVITYLGLEKLGSFKQTVADACEKQTILDAPIVILFILNREKTRPPGLPDLSHDMFLHTWFHDAGAGAYNVMLEAAAWGLDANIYVINNQQAIIDMLKLDEEITIPIFAVPIGS